MIVIAHRGANRKALENSFEAFDLAIKEGADRLELDIHLSADRQIFVLHDENLERTTSMGKQKICDLNSLEILKLKLLNDQPIPPLRDVLRKYAQQVSINIEIKSRNPDVAVEAITLVKDLKVEPQIIFSSFYPEQLEVLRDRAPGIKRAALWGHYTREFAPPFFENPSRLMEWAKTSIIHPEAELVDSNFMTLAKQESWQVFVWVPLQEDEVSSKNMWQRMLDLHVDGICTNYPFELKSWLKEKG